MTATKTHYEIIAKRINKELKAFDGEGLTPRVEAFERGSDGMVILLNDDAYDFCEFSRRVEDIIYGENVYVIGNNDFYLEPFDGMTLKVAL
ncbi:MAG: hypothetical protein KGZ81_07235 [Flavobacteriales bacterium]|nr:hypothetical protein [Flavobacteriales bacterium]